MSTVSSVRGDPSRGAASGRPAALPEFARLTNLAVLVIALGAAWTFMSRLPDTLPRASSPPPNPKEGFAAPDFALDSLDGTRVTLSELRGQPVVINVWASWCFPCQAEMPALQRVYQRYKDEGVIVLGVNMTSQDTEAAARSFVEERGLTFPVLFDRDGSVSSAYQVMGLPSTFFVDRSGVIRSVVVGGPMSDAVITSRVKALLAVP